MRNLQLSWHKCVLSSSPNDVDALTPAHFLIGEQMFAPPEPNHLEAKASWLTRWQRVQQLTQFFWKRWQSEYLNQLQSRFKWRNKENEPSVNDEVLIREENLPATQWQKGIITELHPGDDGHTRVVTLKVGGATMKRSITKICPFPKGDRTDDISANCMNVFHSRKVRKYRENGVNVLLLNNLLVTSRQFWQYFVH